MPDGEALIAEDDSFAEVVLRLVAVSKFITLPEQELG
jgi:hypothetical protein